MDIQLCLAPKLRMSEVKSPAPTGLHGIHRYNFCSIHPIHFPFQLLIRFKNKIQMLARELTSVTQAASQRYRMFKAQQEELK